MRRRQAEQGGLVGHLIDAPDLVGHSYGSITSAFEASRFGDVDALLLTGYSHDIHLETPLAIETPH